ncbi:MAG TPA: C4-dicarboxylate ABC transporter permease, partial [Thermodesulfobacteriota bacterium]
MAEERKTAPEAEEAFITEERLKKAAAFIEEEEGPSRRLTGKMGVFITVVAVIMSLLHLYAAAGIIMTQILRGIHVMFVLFLVFLVFPSLKRFRNRVLWYDYILAALGVAVIVYVFLDFEEFIYRAVTPTPWDLVFGTLLIALVLEATRRTTSWILPVVVGSFLVYAY